MSTEQAEPEASQPTQDEEELVPKTALPLSCEISLDLENPTQNRKLYSANYRMTVTAGARVTSSTT